MGTHPIFESNFDCLTDKMSLVNQMRDLFAHPDQLLAFARENRVQFGLAVPDLVGELIEQCEANVAGELLLLGTEQPNKDELVIPLLEVFDPEQLPLSTAIHLIGALGSLLRQVDNNYTASLTVSTLFHMNTPSTTIEPPQDADGCQILNSGQASAIVGIDQKPPIQLKFIHTQLLHICPELPRITTGDKLIELGDELFVYYARLVECFASFDETAVNALSGAITQLNEWQNKRLAFTVPSHQINPDFIATFDALRCQLANFATPIVTRHLLICRDTAKLTSEMSDVFLAATKCLLHLSTPVYVYQTRYLIDQLNGVLVSSLNAINPFTTLVALTLTARLLIGTGQLSLEPAPTSDLINALAVAAIRQPLECIRLNAIRVLTSLMSRIEAQTRFRVLVTLLQSTSNGAQEADEEDETRDKLVSFLVPHAKDFLLSAQSAQFNTDLLWSAVLTQPGREITGALDVIMPTLSLIRVRHMATNGISVNVDRMITTYLDRIKQDVIEGQRYYAAELQGEKKSERQETFCRRALMQIDLVNSILEVC